MRWLAVVLSLIWAQAAAAADAKTVIAGQLQALMDATSNGDARVWDRLLDSDCLYVEEDDTVKSKSDMVKEAVPLPKGISGTIKVELLRFHADGNIAVAVSRDHETENYFGQVLHAEYLSTSTWKNEADGWKLIAAQVLAEPIDPAAIALPLSALTEYAGRYKLKDSDVVYSVTIRDRALFGNRDGKAPTLMNAELRDVFFFAGQPRIRMIFLRDASGRIRGFVSRREGRDVVWERAS